MGKHSFTMAPIDGRSEVSRESIRLSRNFRSSENVTGVLNCSKMTSQKPFDMGAIASNRSAWRFGSNPSANLRGLKG